MRIINIIKHFFVLISLFTLLGCTHIEAMEDCDVVVNQARLDRFKTVLSGDFPGIGAVVEQVELLKPDISSDAIGGAFSECADKFSKHDFFSINRFAGSSSATSDATSELADEDLMDNWRRWYAYKLFSSYYCQKSFDPKDETLADKFLAHSYLLTYRDNPKYVGIEATASEFYEKQSEIQKEIESRLLAKGIDCKDLVTYASDVYN